MEFIQGTPLLRYAEEHQLGGRPRLELMGKVCEAVQHAHQRGIIHRDLKPGNILVDQTGQPKIVDFMRGARHRCRRVGFLPHRCRTSSGHLGLHEPRTGAGRIPRGTRYPQRCVRPRGDRLRTGRLAGRLPYQIGDQLTKAAQTICEADPVRLSSIDRTYRGDIETIVAKALEKDKSARSLLVGGGELAADIRRYLQEEPIVARRASVVYQLRKFARRHRALVTSVATALVMLAGRRNRQHLGGGLEL